MENNKFFDKVSEIVNDIPEVSDGVNLVQEELEAKKQYNLIDEEIAARMKELGDHKLEEENLEEATNTLNNIENGGFNEWAKEKSSSVKMTQEEIESTVSKMEIIGQNMQKLKENENDIPDLADLLDLSIEIKNRHPKGISLDKFLGELRKFNNKFENIGCNMENKRDAEMEAKTNQILYKAEQLAQMYQARVRIGEKENGNATFGDDVRVIMCLLLKRMESFQNQTENLLFNEN